VRVLAFLNIVAIGMKGGFEQNGGGSGHRLRRSSKSSGDVRFLAAVRVKSLIVASPYPLSISAPQLVSPPALTGRLVQSDLQRPSRLGSQIVRKIRQLDGEA